MQSDPFGWVGHTVAGKFRVEALVAEGGFGVVYRALHVGFEARIALKCLKLPARLQGSEREKFLEAFLAEGRLLHQLSRATAGIVQALDVGAAVSPSGAWTPYLALEWLEGAPLDADLAERARRGVPGRSLAETVVLLDSAARALALAHEQGVAHRDLKPGNLFLAAIGGKRVSKVLDFGIAKVVADVSNLARALQETGGAIQAFTPQYGAPEQFDRRYGATGPWTDVFAFALVLVEVMTGRPALDGADTTQLFVSSMRPDRRPTPRASGLAVSDSTEALFASALAVEPGARLPSMGVFWTALAAEASRPVVAGATGPVDALAATAYGPAPTPPTAPLGPYATPAPAASPLAASALVPLALAATALAPPPAARPARLWVGLLAGAGALVVVAAVVVVIVALRVESGRSAGGSAGGLPAAGGSGATLRAAAAQKLLRKDPSCAADFDTADRLDPAGATPTFEPAHAFCEMLAGRCEQGRRRYRAYVIQTSPAGAENAVDAVSAQYCLRDQLMPGARVLALTMDVNAAWQKGDTSQCVAVGSALVTLVDTIPDRTGAQQTSRSEAAGALSTAAQCAAKGGRCDEASTFYRARMRVLIKGPTPAPSEAAFRAAYPECAKK